MPFDHPLPALPADVEFWSLRFVEEAQRNLRGAQERSAAVRRRHRPRRDGHRLRRRRLRLRRDRRHVARRARGGARARRALGARDRAASALIDSRTLPRPGAARRVRVAVAFDAPLPSRREWYDLLTAESRAAAIDPRIVDWEAIDRGAHRDASPRHERGRRRRPALPLPVCPAIVGDRARRRRHADAHAATATAASASRAASRCSTRFGFVGAGRRDRRGGARAARGAELPERARMDVLLMPDQMILQIHESIGHPLELDRILGDERNFAGTSFVTLDMFGTLPLRLRRCSTSRSIPTRAGGARELRASTTTARRAREDVPDPRRHPRAAARRRDLAGARRAARASRTRAPTAGTARRSTAWRTSTSSRATRRSTSMIAGIERGVLHARPTARGRSTTRATSSSSAASAAG